MKKFYLFSMFVVLNFLTYGQVPNYIPENGLVGWWPFNGNANDESGNGNDGVVFGATSTSDRFGNNNSAYSFDGISNRIDVQHSAGLSIFGGQSSSTISLWCYGSFNTSGEFVAKGFHSVNVAEYGNRYLATSFVSGNNESLYNVLYNATTINSASCPNNLFTSNQWHHVVFIRGSEMKIFVDGIEVTSTSNNNGWNVDYNLVLDNTSMTFGARSVKDDNNVTFHNFFFSGKLDDIGIWNRALNEQEIAALYSSQNECFPISSITLTAEPALGETNIAGLSYLPNATAVINDQSQWHYIAVTKSGSNGSFYFDGSLVTSGSFESNPYIWNSLLLGATQACVSCSPVANYLGQIDEVRVSNTARSASSIFNHYQSNQPFTSDANTIGLFHLDNISGTSVPNAIGGNASLFGTPTLTQGKFGQALDFDGATDYVRWSNSIPVNNMTLEFWYKSSAPTGTIAMLEFAYNTGVNLGTIVTNMPIVWSNGQTGNSVTVDPSTLPFIAVDNGACSDTIFFNSTSATVYDTVTTNITVYDTLYTNVTVYDTIYTNVTVYDTLYTNVTIYDTVYVSVTDTLIIEVPTGLDEPNAFGEWLVYPNPTSDELTINFGDISLFNGFTIQIMNTMGQIVFLSNVVNQFAVVDVSTWSSGTYLISVLNDIGTEVETKTLIIQ